MRSSPVMERSATVHSLGSSCLPVEGVAMNFTVELPDEIGQWAKESGINLSQTLRAELEAERSRRDTVAGTLTDSAEHKIHVAETGLDYVLHGTLIAQDYDHEVEAYLGQDERIYVYDAGKQRLHEVDTPQDLGDWLADGLYIDAMRALGQKPILHIGQTR
jgi:post-segregation antitoxin (ccd killing protein)